MIVKNKLIGLCFLSLGIIVARNRRASAGQAAFPGIARVVAYVAPACRRHPALIVRASDNQDSNLLVFYAPIDATGQQPRIPTEPCAAGWRDTYSRRNQRRLQTPEHLGTLRVV